MAGTGSAHLRPEQNPILSVQDLVVEFDAGRGQKVHAVSGISLDVLDGETLGLVGESGCGKSTTGRAIMQLPPPTSGSVLLDGVEVTTLNAEELRRTRTRMQLIFQDPISSLNPRRKVQDLVAEGLDIWHSRGGDRKQRVDTLLDAVGLDPAVVGDRRASQLSGGQSQRVCIARALMLDPKVLVCDEPVSSLDVSVQAQILNLLEDTKRRYGLSLLFIAHDLAVVKNISDRIVVMYLGKICEVAPAEQLYRHASHPYTQLLLSSIPEADPDRALMDAAPAGELPSPLSPPSGCRFRTRCPLADETCVNEEPQLRQIGQHHHVACHHAENAVAQSRMATPEPE